MLEIEKRVKYWQRNLKEGITSKVDIDENG
jgi:hypothetical protein